MWSFRGNACDIPTDCPTRERAGWTGDWQLFVPTASYLYDVDGFSRKWLRDLAATQWEDGTLDNMAPMPVAERTGFLEQAQRLGRLGRRGRAGAVGAVPGVRRPAGAARRVAGAWCAGSTAPSGWRPRQRHPDREAPHPEPRPHDRYLWDTGFHWGEWLVPGEDPSDFPAFVAADKARHRDRVLRLVDPARRARSPRLLGEDEEARTVRRAERATSSTPGSTEFLDADGHVVPHTQANLVRALAFGLVPDELRQQTADDLAALVRAAGTHLGTGFLATPDLLPVLADHGHLDLAYELLLQDTAPSWLVMIDRGATTVWERWDGIDEDGVPHESLNHYSKGAVVSFLHRYVAGLQRLEPTWSRFRVAPRPGGGITAAETEHVTPHGRIAVAWDARRTRFALDVDVPEGTTAEVVLPDGTEHELGAGRHTL